MKIYKATVSENLYQSLTYHIEAFQHYDYSMFFNYDSGRGYLIGTNIQYYKKLTHL